MKTIDFPVENRSNIIRADQVQIEFPSKPVRYYRHGWQSWSLAAWTNLDTLPVPKPAIFHPLMDAEYTREKSQYGSWLGAVEFEDGSILFLGALGFGAHISLNRDRIASQSEVGEIEWFIAYGQEKTVFAEYAEQLGNRFGRAKNKQPPRVWCSWYSLFYMIDEPILFRIIERIGDLPFDVLQVDDGWEIKVGDWEANSNFPSGMQALADKIKSTGRKAGLWLAPLIAVESSRLFRENPDWFLRDERGGFAAAGFNWGEQLYALDTTHPAVTAWLASLMRQVRAWGFDYLKLDFLYAGALKGKRHKDVPREGAFRESLQVLREAMGEDAFLLTCGTPILPALGLCDAMRVGPDVASEWESYRDSYLFSNPTTPGTKNAIRTVLHRLWLNPLLHLDPDVAYFAEKWNTLTNEQKALLQDLSLITNFKATSDPPQWMSLQEQEALRTYLNTNPVVEQMSRYVFRLDDRTVDFTPAVSLPEAPKGWTAVWASILGWLANMPFILRLNKRMDDRKFRKRRESI
jgi:alpha-galactosidase